MTSAQKAERLTQIAKEIGDADNARQRAESKSDLYIHQAQMSSDEAATHAKKVGMLLIEAKRLVPHGQWIPWIEQNTKLSERTAQHYMEIAGGTKSRAGKTKRSKSAFEGAFGKGQKGNGQGSKGRGRESKSPTTLDELLGTNLSVFGLRFQKILWNLNTWCSIDTDRNKRIVLTVRQKKALNHEADELQRKVDNFRSLVNSGVYIHQPTKSEREQHGRSSETSA